MEMRESIISRRMYLQLSKNHAICNTGNGSDKDWGMKRIVMVLIVKNVLCKVDNRKKQTRTDQ